jgi:hypothetical protein
MFIAAVLAQLALSLPLSQTNLKDKEDTKAPKAFCSGDN